MSEEKLKNKLLLSFSPDFLELRQDDTKLPTIKSYNRKKV